MTRKPTPTLNRLEPWLNASLLGEAITPALAVVVILTIVLNPQLTHGGPVEDRWPTEIAAPSTSEAANFLNAWDLTKSGAEIVPPVDDPALPSARADATVQCAPSPDTSVSHWMWREIDGRKCWYVGTTLAPKSRLRWPTTAHGD